MILENQTGSSISSDIIHRYLAIPVQRTFCTVHSEQLVNTLVSYKIENLKPVYASTVARTHGRTEVVRESEHVQRKLD